VGERWDIALHSLAALRAEVPDGPLAMRLAQEEEALAAGGADSRGARTGSAPLVVPVVRVYFVARIVSPMRRTPLFVDRPFMTWNGGTIVAMRPEERDQPPWKGHEAHLVYYDKGAFLEDMETLTETQLYRELRRRLAGPPRSEHDELVASLAFEHAVQVHLLAATAGADGASTAAAWRRAAATAADNFAAIAAALNPHAADEAPRRLARLQADLALASAVAKLPPGPTDSARLLDDAQAALSPLLP
jgi:hypothetical protein